MLKEGSLAPDFELPSTEGETLSLGAQLGRGPVVLCFLAEGCATSEMALPLIERLWVELRDHVSAEGSSLAVWGIAQADRSRTVALRGELGLSFPVLADSTLAVSRAYDLDVTPTLLLLQGHERLRSDAARVGGQEMFRITELVEAFNRRGYEQVSDAIAARVGTLPVDLLEGRDLPETRPG